MIHRIPFNERREQLNSSGLFKKVQKKLIPEFKKILECLYQSKGKLRSQQISDFIGLQKKYVDGRLRRLKNERIVTASGMNMKYVQDILNSKPVFPGQIGERVDMFFKNLLKDALRRKSIKKILLETLHSHNDTTNTLSIKKCIGTIENLQITDDFDQVLNLLKSNIDDKLLGLYQEIFKEIESKGLYNPNNGYGELSRKRIAYKYSLNI